MLATVILGCIAPPFVQAQDKPKTESKADPGVFYPIADAKDCAFDESRQRLYVTTPKQLVVVDTKAKKVIESIDLLGTPQGCDISPDFKYLAIAPIKAQYLYWVKLDWAKASDMEISQVKFTAPSNEPGVFSVGIGADNTVLFSTTFSGSGGVSLRRFDPATNKVDIVGKVNMDSVITPSGDRKFASVAEGNISSGPVKLFDFKEQKLNPVVNMNCFHFEMACSSGAKFFARPFQKGLDLYDNKGGKLGTLEGNPVLCAAFHPKSDSIFVMRHGELNIQEYDVAGQKLSNAYPLDQPLVMKADVQTGVVANIQPIGKDVVIANFRKVVRVTFRTYESGRLKVSESGETLCAVIPSGVFMFPVKPRTNTDGDKPKPKIKVIETDPSK